MARLLPLRYRLMILSTTLAFTAMGAAAMSFIDTRDVKIRAAEWAEAAKTNGVLPTTLKELEGLPVSYRIAAFQAATPEIRSSLMRQHLGAFKNFAQLSTAQIALMDRLISIASPALYDDTHVGRSAAQEQLRELCQGIPKLFSEDQRRVFSSLGLTTVPDEAQYVAWVRSAQTYFGTQVVNADTYFHNCNCAEDTYCPDCNSQSGCAFGKVPRCSDTWFGCGCALAESCVGECIIITVSASRP
jgi:hypothetical protein